MRFYWHLAADLCAPAQLLERRTSRNIITEREEKNLEVELEKTPKEIHPV